MADQASGPPLSSQHDEVLQQRVEALEQERAEFIKLKQQLEAEFNQKRAKFKELYMTKEVELKKQTLVLDGAQVEISSLQAQLEEARSDMENIRTVATVSENTKQEAIDQVRSQWQEEVASLQAIMKDTVSEYEVQFHHRLEQERSQWNQYREVMERELGELRRRLTEGQEEENLEDEMKKAQEDAEKLRSVVMPLEKEIATLKSSAEERAKELEASKVKELNHVLEAEKSCRTDLEMYVAVLNTQKSVLQEDAEKLRKELHEVCHKLELERQQHNQLKHTWQRANDQFLESQRLLMRDMQRIENVLSSEQLRQVEEMRKKDQEEDEKERLSQVNDLQEEDFGDNTEPLEDLLLGLSVGEPNLSTHGSLHSLDTDVVAGVLLDPYKENLRRVQSTDSLGSSLSVQQGLGGHNHKAKSASNLDESDFGPLVGADCGAMDSSFGDTLSISSMKLTASHFLLTKDQEKAIKAMTPEQEETASLLSSISHAPDNAYLPPGGYRLVSDSEWNLLQQEVKNAGRQLGRRCDMCSNYEKQLQAIQGQEADTRDQVKKLQVMLRQANDHLERTMTEKQTLEDSVKVGNEETAAKVSALVQRVQDSETLLCALQQAFSDAKRNTQQQMAVLGKSREQVADELSRLQRDNENLQGTHRLHEELQQQEDFQMPNTVQELHGLVVRFREDVVALRTSADHMEEKLKAEILFLKEQNQAEQCLKENLEETLQTEIESCKEEIASFSSLKTEMERIKVEKEKFERSLSEKTETLENLQGLRISLERQLRELSTAKSALQAQAMDEKDKAQRLQTELDVSEQVQKDFVKLSQTLQVQLERIRQADSLQRIKVILNDTNLTDINQLPDT
ncbi:rab GTPase-binding effector protein 1 [Trematomus bernacchii]|uniref:rab GTPase-binding effector protein 1 n=1 Tax=Trematomus bernacchii TaxID=40690 RepID=UPI001469FBD0|nr:rab GTPase-binding effector protein 1 [Trematomus bernacchii]